MGIINNIFKEILKPVAGSIATIIKEQNPEMNSMEGNKKQPDRISTMEVPPNAYMGYPWTGTSKRKMGSNIDFDTLRTFSVMYDVARACINARKRQINNLEWAILPKDEKADPEKYRAIIDQLTAFWEKPMNGMDFKGFIDRIMEDMLVFDAVVLWKDKTYGRKLDALVPVDASTIRIKILADGYLPDAPDTAYQQIINGTVAGEYTVDDIHYEIFNPRTSTPYGLSALETLIIGVDAVIRSQLYNSSLLSEGTVPEGFFSVPTTWTPEQIKDYQIWFDSLLGGNLQTNSRIKFMPGGTGVGYTPTKKVEDMRYLEFEKWILMKTCALFDIQPQAIGFLDNVTLANGETQQELGNARGLIPTAKFLEKIFNKIIKDDFGYTDVRFAWKGLQVVDDEFELERNQALLKNGALTIDEWRTDQGREPFGIPASQKPLIYTAGGAVLLESVGVEPVVTDNTTEKPNPSSNENGKDEENTDSKALAEMDKWETKCLNYNKKDKPIPEFEAVYIEKAEQALLRIKLLSAKTKEDIKNSFRPFKEATTERILMQKALKLNDDLSKHNIKKYEKVANNN
jgi:hypothetical protein